MTRITVRLLEDERLALLRISEEQRRPPAEQAAWLIRQQLETLGALVLEGVTAKEVPHEYAA